MIDKIMGIVLVCLTVGLIFGGLPLIATAADSEEFWTTAYYCVYEFEMDGTQTVTSTFSGTTYTLKASFLFGGHGVAMQGTGRMGPTGDYIHYIEGGGGFVSVDDPVDDAEIRARYAALGVTDFTGFGNIGLAYPSSATYSVVSGVTGASGRTLIPWYSIAVDPSLIPLGTNGLLLFKSGTTPDGSTHMSFHADDTGGAITGNRIDIYVGEGESGIDEWARTGGNRNVEVDLESLNHEVPLSPYYPESNKQWWQYQFEGYPDFTNNNCGPASAAMVINYLKGKGLSTKKKSFASKDIPNVHCTARGYYCQAYLKAHGYPEEIWKKGYGNSDWSSPGARDYQIQNALSLEGVKSHVVKGEDYKDAEAYLMVLEDAIDRGCTCIAVVNPKEYVATTTITSHWTVIYGYDDNYIYLNDPGWNRFETEYPISKSDFNRSLWNVEPKSWKEVIIVDTTVRYQVPIDIILDTDRSGSMSGPKIIDAKNAATLFVDLLESQDQVGLVSFSSSATLDLHLTSDFEHAKSVIAGYSGGGSTNMGDALSKSIQELKANGRDDTIWSIIYFTDGQTNAGLTKAEILDTLVPEAVDAGIIIYTLGYGSNVDESFLRQVAEATGGKYYFAPDSAKLMEIYIKLSQKIKGMEKIAEFTGIVSQGETKTKTFVLESKTSFMRTFLIWPGSDLDLTVIDPSGNQIIPGPGIIYSGNDALPEYYEIYNPQIGEWTIEVYGKDVTGTTEDYTVMVFQPGALIQVNPTKWDIDYPLNRKMTFGVSEIAGNVDLTNVAFTASDLTEAIATSTVKSLMKSQAEAEERGDVAIATLTKEAYAQNVNIIPPNCFSFTPNKFSVPAGNSVDVQATLTLPSASIPSGTYSGNIYVNSSGGNATISVTAIVTSVNTSTGTGTAYFAPDAGSIEDLIGLDESALPEENPTVDFPHGLFSFNITGLNPGQTVNITITFPQDIPSTAQYWKYHAPEGWYQIPMDSNDGDNIITITLQDGGIGDDDGVANGVIVDQGGPGITTVVARVPTLTLTGLVALIGLLSCIAINKIRKRGK